MVKVLIVDDSAFMRKAIADILKRDKEISIVGEARDGEEAIKLFKEVNPDVITLDYEMPKKNGLEVIQEVMNTKPTPIVMISSYTKEGALVTFKCLEAGAVDFIPKDIEKGTFEVLRKANEIIEKIKNAARARANLFIKKDILYRTRGYTPSASAEALMTPSTQQRVSPAKLPTEMRKLVVIGASTGGPNTVSEIFSIISPIPAGFVVAIHMPAIFTSTYAQRLSEKTGFPAKEAEDRDKIEPSKILVAPGGKHLIIERGGTVRITDEPRDAIYKPSIDVTMETAADAFRDKVIGVILTGMGNDGSKGIKKIKEKGGKVIVENEKSAVVFGMPRSAIETGCADYIEDAHRIPSIIEKLVLS